MRLGGLALAMSVLLLSPVWAQQNNAPAPSAPAPAQGVPAPSGAPSQPPAAPATEGQQPGKSGQNQPAQAQNQPAQNQPPPAPAQKYRNKEGELRVSQLIGAAVSNDQNQGIGNISDVLLGQDNKAVKAVLSVGGFLGVGSRLVEVPFGDLQIGADKIVLPGATKVSLENLSAYQSP